MRCRDYRRKMNEKHKARLHRMADMPTKFPAGAVRVNISHETGEKDLADAQLDPKEIQDKLRPSDDMALYLTVKSYVTMYFIKIRDILRNADKKGEIDYEQVQDQMKAIYRRLKKAKKSNAQIFNSIVEKVQHVSLQDTPYCQIVVSFFIQSCEVFDAIS